jgi:hypothetical protein
LVNHRKVNQFLASATALCALQIQRRSASNQCLKQTTQIACELDKIRQIILHKEGLLYEKIQ